MEKERHLRRLATLLVDERVLGAALSNRLKELAMLYEAGKAMNSVLVVDEVLQLILSSAFELLEASSGSIMLLEDHDNLVVVCRAGNARRRTRRAGRRDRRPGGAGPRAAARAGDHLGEGPPRDRERRVRTAAPPGRQVLGVINLNGAPDHIYSEHDLRAVSLVRRARRHRRRQRPAL